MIIPRIKPITVKRLKQIRSGRNTEKYRQWRKDVMARDGHKCNYPGCSNTERLEVHHIKKFVNNKHLRTDIINGITLCEECHKKIQNREHRYELLFFKIVQSNMKKYEKKN